MEWIDVEANVFSGEGTKYNVRIVQMRLLGERDEEL